MSNVMDFTLPEVATLHQKARFFMRDGRNFVEISFPPSKDSVVKKVQPIHMAQFREEWNSFCDGTPMKQRKGTPLTDISTIKELRVDHYISNNIHNLEELASLSDAQCQSLGHGALTEREATRKLLTQRTVEQNTKIRDFVMKEQATVGPRPDETYASASDLTAVNEKIDSTVQAVTALSNSVADLVRALNKPKGKPGRPPKVKTEEPSQ